MMKLGQGRERGNYTKGNKARQRRVLSPPLGLSKFGKGDEATREKRVVPSPLHDEALVRELDNREKSRALPSPRLFFTLVIF